MCGVRQVRLCVCVSYEECRLAVGLPDSECVVFGRSVCVCVSYEECRVAVNVLERVSVWCWAGPSVCACVIRVIPSSCRSAGEIECVVLCRSVCVCVLYEERRVAVGLLQRVSVVLGRSVCVCVCVCLRGMLSSCRSAGESKCVVLCRSVCVCVCHMRNAE